MNEIVLATIDVDSHMWNLVYLELFLTERKFLVRNLGANTPKELLLESSLLPLVRYVVISSINGLGYLKGLELGRLIRRGTRGKDLTIVIGGKLTINGELTCQQQKKLLKAGYNRVFLEHEPMESLDSYLGVRRI